MGGRIAGVAHRKMMLRHRDQSGVFPYCALSLLDREVGVPQIFALQPP